MTAAECFRELAASFEQAGIPEPEPDAQLIFEHVTGFARRDLFLRGDEVLIDEKEAILKAYRDRRLAGEPVQYILGEAWFYGYRFSVKPGVLIPRFDTEILAEEALKVIRPGERVLDLCTGSGCLIIALAKEAEIEGIGSDISGTALETAEQNNKELQAGCLFVQSDLFEQIAGRFDLIVSNPPYIKTEVIGTLMREVKDHEPRLALDGGTDGLNIYRRIVKSAPQYLNPGGHLMLEIGYDQADDVSELLSKNGFREIKTVRDLAGNDRVVSAVRPETAEM